MVSEEPRLPFHFMRCELPGSHAGPFLPIVSCLTAF
jgi:hypothetical protein